MTQLVDVILVLMIVFMVTSPVIRHTVKIDPPHASNQKQDTTTTHGTIDSSQHNFSDASYNKTLSPSKNKAFPFWNLIFYPSPQAYFIGIKPDGSSYSFLARFGPTRSTRPHRDC